MKPDIIFYRERHWWKYTLESDYSVNIDIHIPEFMAGTYFDGLVTITVDGALLIRKGYCWDGASGPAIDTKSIMRPSLIHDVLYQLISEGCIDSGHRKRADIIFRKELWKDVKEITARSKFSRVREFLGFIRIWYSYWAVRKFGAKFAKYSVHTAPVLGYNIFIDEAK